VIIAVDFDNTIVENEFPEIGEPLPGAFTWLKRWKDSGATLILYTLRSNHRTYGDVLTQAVEFCKERGLEFDYVNENPEQSDWTDSPKVYADYYIDDRSLGVPLTFSKHRKGQLVVNWAVIGKKVMNLLRHDMKKKM